MLLLFEYVNKISKVARKNHIIHHLAKKTLLILFLKMVLPSVFQFSIFDFHLLRGERVREAREWKKRLLLLRLRETPHPPNRCVGWIKIDTSSLFFQRNQLSKTTTNSCQNSQPFVVKTNLILMIVDNFYHDRLVNLLFGLK